MGNPVVYFEVGAADARLLVAFYGELFGWELRGSSSGTYTMIDTRGGDGVNGGIATSRSGESWSTFYAETDDLQATLDRANALGGVTVMPITPTGGTAMAMFSDPDGLRVGLVRAPAGPAPGNHAAPSTGSGEPVTWFEILGPDAARTQRFYADLFGWSTDLGIPGYAVTNTGAGRGIHGGIGGGVEPFGTIVYVGVPDVDETLGRAEKLGGSRVLAPGLSALKNEARAALYGSADDIDTGWFRDPAGNVFGVFHKQAR
ncbi:MAG: VOC family protein [Micromonosporaceae bacterium]